MALLIISDQSELIPLIRIVFAPVPACSYDFQKQKLKMNALPSQKLPIARTNRRCIIC